MIDWITNIDHRLFMLINQQWAAEWLDPLMIAASHRLTWIPLYAIMIWLLVRRFGRKKGLVMTLMLVLAFGISDSFSSRVMKPGFKRKRPFLVETLNARLPNGPFEAFAKRKVQYGFVSSHSSNFFAITTLTIFFLGRSRRMFLIFHGIAALVAYSRVYLGVHFPADVAVGAILGAGVAWLLYWLYTRYLDPRLSDSPVPAA